MILSIILIAIVVAYILLVYIQMRKPVTVKYNAVFAKFLRFILPPQMIAISLWRTCWLLWSPLIPRGQLSPKTWDHEINGHILNKNQWAGRPYIFPFLYLWEQMRVGYDKNKYEQEARQIAGEELR